MRRRGPQSFTGNVLQSRVHARPKSESAEPAADNGPRVHLLIPTHTTRHLDTCLASLAHQTRPPDSVVLTCDSDDTAIGELAERTWERVRGVAPAWPRLIHTRRPHQGQPRLNQVRNNGLRALDRAIDLREDDLVVVVDGDTMLEQTALEQHRRLAAEGYALIAPYRVDLDPERTARVSVDWLLDRHETPAIRSLLRAADQARLRRRHRRAALHNLLRHLGAPGLGLQKAHKPKLLGGHHAARVKFLRAVNGYDEHFRGDGTDDDDLARRLYMLRPRVRAACPVSQVLAFHLYHPTRRPWRPSEAPDHARFARALDSPRAERGWDNPLEQPDAVISFYSAAPAVTARSAALPLKA